MSFRNQIRFVVYSFLLSLGMIMFYPRTSIDKKLMTYDRKFHSIYESICHQPLRVSNLRVIEFHKLKYPIIGICIPFYNGFRIYIDPKTFNEFNEVDKESLYFHEAMHCYLGQLHLSEDEYPDHFMNPEMPEYNPGDRLYMQLKDLIYKSCY